MSNLLSIMVLQKDISTKIKKFLTLRDHFMLSQTSKTAKTIFTSLMIEKAQIYLSTYLTSLEYACKIKKIQEKQKNQKLPKDKKLNSDPEIKKPDNLVKIKKNIDATFKLDQTSQCKIIKVNLNDLPKIVVAQGLWQLVSYEHLESMFEDQLTPILNKFKQSNAFFLSCCGRYVISMNRTLIDKSLNFEVTDKQDEDENKKQWLQQISESSEWDTSAMRLDSMQEIISRQRKVLSQIESKTRVQDFSQRLNEKPSLHHLLDLNMYSLILCHGGYFAIGVFEKGQCVFHKSDHKYVKRGKQGQRQLNKDSQSGSQVQSMGSQIRRDQEKKHQEKVSNILTEAFDLLKKCDINLLQAPGLNQQLLVQEEKPLFELRNQLRSICLTAKKANYTEVERIQKTISKVMFIEILEKIQDNQFF